MANTNAVAGTAYVKVDGAQLALGGDFTVSPDMFEREGLTGLSGVVGYKEMPRVPFIKGTVYKTGLKLKDVLKWTSVTVTAELIDGTVVTLREAWVKGGHELNAAEGTFEIEFNGMGSSET